MRECSTRRRKKKKETVCVCDCVRVHDCVRGGEEEEDGGSHGGGRWLSRWFTVCKCVAVYLEKEKVEGKKVI